MTFRPKTIHISFAILTALTVAATGCTTPAEEPAPGEIAATLPTTIVERGEFQALSATIYGMASDWDSNARYCTFELE